MVTKIAEERKLGRRLVRGHPMLEAEVVYAVQNEYCETAEDFIARRTRLAFLDVDACREALPRVSSRMRGEYFVCDMLLLHQWKKLPPSFLMLPSLNGLTVLNTCQDSVYM